MSQSDPTATEPSLLVRQGPIFLVGLGHGATHWVAATFYLLLPFINRDMGLSYSQAGLLVSIFHIASVGANFGSGPLVDVTGRRVLFQILALVLGGSALMAFAAGAGFVWLAAMVVLIGATNNLWHPAAIAYLSSRYPKKRGYALSIHALGANLGDAIAPLAAGMLLVSMSWPGAAAVNSLPVFAVAAALFLLWKGDRTDATHGKPGMGLGDYFAGMGRLIRNRAVLGLCLMAGLRTTAQNGLLMFLPLYLVDVLKADALETGTVMMAMQVGGILAVVIAGTLSDRIGRRPIVLAGLGASTVVIAGLTLLGGGPLYVAGVALLGFVLFAVRPVVHSWMMDLTPGEMGGSATSLMFGAQAGLSAIVPIAGGIVADIWGLPAVFYLLAALMLMANMTAALLPGKAAAAE